jgi:chitin synthase
MIADGLVKGTGNDDYTPDILLNVLGYEHRVDPEPKPYHALGDGNLQFNVAKVYSGVYSLKGKDLPYIVVVKVGDFLERGKKGNRGKRDSQLILMQFLSRLHSQEPMNPLELEINRHFIYRVGIDARNFEFLLYLDSDTEIYPDSIAHFVAHMTADSSIAGICGETLLRNEQKSWITMIQVYEYFITHHLAKSFESLFGTVTCLPGCFSLYRIWSRSNGIPVLASQKIVKEYGVNTVDTLHLKNLLSLGEDRYLTTLMLKTFPEMKLKFSADAKALTTAPESWSVLVSQRRRWINSTVHNLVELVMLDNMCGCCLFSIRFVVLMDLFATVMAPAGFVYVVWLIISLIMNSSRVFPLISLVIIGAIYGLQVLIFIAKQEWQHLGWMIFVKLFNSSIFWQCQCILFGCLSIHSGISMISLGDLQDGLMEIIWKLRLKLKLAWNSRVTLYQ